MNRVVTIALTGGIASGKTNVTKVLKKLGAVVLNADLIAHSTYEPNTQCFRKLVNTFGQDIVDSDGRINRKILGAKVFGSPTELKKLNDIVWPETKASVYHELDKIRAAGRPAVAVIEAAGLIEAGWHKEMDEVWVTVVPPAVAMERLKTSRGLSEEEAAKRLASQITNEERIRHAKVVIHTDGPFERTEAQVLEGWRRLLEDYKLNIQKL